MKGEYPAAIATLERALRIEPSNPLVWIELGQVHLASRNAPQAESMGRKAVALATGAPQLFSRLPGDSWGMRFGPGVRILRLMRRISGRLYGFASAEFFSLLEALNPRAVENAPLRPPGD